MSESLYLKKVKCICCEKTFESSRVRPSFKKSVRTDADFCKHYNGVNPEFYVVRVCPFCGFSSTENFSENLTSKQKKLFQEKIGNQWNSRDYCGTRTWEEALQTFQFALLCAQIKEEKQRVIAGILHHIAWLYRYRGEWEKEKRFLQHALNTYIKVFETEEQDLNNARLMFLIGELHRRLSQYNDAVKWFSRVINDKRIMDAAMIRASREQWAATREDMIAANIEPPEQ